MNDRSAIKWTLILNIILLFVLCIWGGHSRGSTLYPLLLIWDSFIATYAYRGNKGFLLMLCFIFYCNYSIAMGVYFDPSIVPEFYDQVTREQIYDEGIISLILFNCALLLSSFFRKRRIVISSKRTIPMESVFLETLCIFVYVYLFITQTTWSVGERMSATAFGEYKYFFAMLGCLYAPKTRFHRIVWTLLLLVSSLIGFAGGNRVDSFPMMLILLVVWYSSIPLKKIALYGAPLIIILKLIGEIRGDLSLLVNFDMLTIIQRTFDGFMVQDTFIYAYFPSISSIDLGYIQPFETKMSLLWDNFIYIFAGGSYGDSIFSNYTLNYYRHCQGFIGALNLNYWIGYMGPVLLGLVVGFMINKLYNCDIRSKSFSIEKAIYICMICTAPRWYVYNFFALFRSILLFLILLYTFRYLTMFIGSKRHYLN